MSCDNGHKRKSVKQGNPSSTGKHSSDSFQDTNFGISEDILKYFNNLKWDRMDSRSLAIARESFFPLEKKTESYAQNLIESKLIPFPTKPFKLEPLPGGNEVGVEKKFNYLPGLDLKYQPNVTKVSVLTEAEQNKLFYFYFKMTLLKKTLNPQETQKFQEFRNKIAQEYEEYQKIVHKDWLRNFSRTMVISPAVNMYLENLWKKKVAQILDIYPDRYKQHRSQIPLTLTDPNQDFSVMDFVKDVFFLGLPPALGIPNTTKKPILLVENYEDLCKIKPISLDLSQKFLTNPIFPITKDPVLDLLLEKKDLDIDVVMTSSGIKTLVDNFEKNQFVKEWALPIIVKQVPRSEGKGTKKVVIIDKKLPPCYLSILEKNLWHAKIVSKWALIFNEYPTLLESVQNNEIKMDERKLTSYEDIFNNDDIMSEDALSETSENSMDIPENDLQASSSGICDKPSEVNDDAQSIISKDSSTVKDDLVICEEFGIDPGPSIKRRRKNKKKIKKANLSNEGIGDSEAAVSNNKETESIDIESGEIIDEPDSASVKNKTGLVKKKFAKKGQIKKPCIYYRLWKLHKNRYYQLSKAEQRSVNVLVRTRLDGRLKRCLNNVWTCEDSCVSSKLEFQPEYGAYQMTASELIREYVDLHLRPESNLVRVRSIGHTKEVMMSEIKNYTEIKENLRSYDISVQRLFDPLYAVLTNILNLPDGQYILRHTNKMGAFAQLLVHHPGGSFFLSSVYRSLMRTDNFVPAIPIDPTVLTPLHHRDKLPPLLFRPTTRRNYKPPGKLTDDELKEILRLKKNRKKLFKKAFKNIQ